MRSQGFSFMEREQKRFISYSLNDGDILMKTELEMLKNNDIFGILPVSEIHDNNMVTLLYDITSKQQFSKRMSGIFSGSQLYGMLGSICKVMLLLNEYMINPAHLVFNMEYMCFDYDKDEIQFAVLPVKDVKKSPDINKFLADIYRHLQYSDNTLRDFPNYIYNYINSHPQIDIKEFKGYLEDTYNSLCGVIQPVEAEPPMPSVNYNAEREIINTDEVKETVQSRFITQSEKILEFENITENRIKSNIIQKQNKNSGIAQGITPGSFSVPSPSGAFTTPSAKEKKRKEKPAKKQKEKIIKEKKAKEKKEDKPKEKKGLFGFGKRNKKEATKKEADIIPQPVIQPVTSANNIKVPVQNIPQYANNIPSYANGIQGVPTQKIQPFVNNIQEIPIQDTQLQRSAISGITKNPVMPWQTIQNKEKIPVNGISGTSIDISGIDDGLDSTVLLDTGKIIVKPVLRSKVTGEVIKIEKPGFIIGRNKMVNGKTAKMPDGQRPDVSINIKSISHIHAVFLWHDNRWHIKDTNSLNGTFVNGNKLEDNAETALNEGDIVCFASEEYEFIFIK